MISISILVIITLLIGFVLGYFLATYNAKNIYSLNDSKMKNEKDEIILIKEELENAFKALASDVAKSNSEEFLKLANDKFKNLKNQSDDDLEQKKKLIDQNLDQMSKKLDNIQRQSTELNTSLTQNKDETEKLRDTTIQLREILSSSQKRGQWGERMVEDILDFLGLMENVNYKKQLTINSGERPDFTFMLPKNKKINMDVKFPLSHYEKYIDSKDEGIMNKEKKEFLSDVKNHIKTISNRNYIDPASGTLDYVLMFIPNESIYSFINKEDYRLIDFGLKNKVLLCSPLTLYAILALINQATRNFAMEQKAAEVMTLMDAFKIQWNKYIDVMDKIGRSIQSMQNDYDQLVTTRKKQLEKPLKKIDEITEKIEFIE